MNAPPPPPLRMHDTRPYSRAHHAHGRAHRAGPLSLYAALHSELVPIPDRLL